MSEAKQVHKQHECRAKQRPTLLSTDGTQGPLIGRNATRETPDLWKEINAFWLRDIGPEQWRVFDPAFDALLAQRFSTVLQQAAAGELFAWREQALGRLAEVIVLDQFSRNIHRGTALAFAQDPMALALAQEAVSAGALSDLGEQERSFLLMPYMHSESRVIHVLAEALFKQYAPLRYEPELRHKAIIDRFGRYPHRNQIVRRASTPEEIHFLTLPGSSF